MTWVKSMVTTVESTQNEKRHIGPVICGVMVGHSKKKRAKEKMSEE